VETVGLEALARTGELIGFWEDGGLASLCYVGANMVPVNASERALVAFAARAGAAVRRPSSIVGPSHSALRLADLLSSSWGRPREVRAQQPVLAIDADPVTTPDPAVRLVRPDEVEILLPAAVAMFTEEVGVDPRADGGAAVYHARVSELVYSGRAYARIDDGRVVFKAEVGAVSRYACQIQGVWVHPRLRGRGIAVPAMASVVRHCLRDHAAIVSLYVNDYNAAARATYASVGFDQVGTFGTVLY
jgi:predicted GNAT family acetyltransferase